MRVLLKTSLKGTQTWVAGNVFDSSQESIPPEILHEVRVGSSLVEVLPEVAAPPLPMVPPALEVIPATMASPFMEPEIPPALEVEPEVIKEAYSYGHKKEKHQEEATGKKEERAAKDAKEVVPRSRIRK